MARVEDFVVIDSLEAWTQEHLQQLTDGGLSATFTRGPVRAKTGAWLDLDSHTRVGRLILWTTGEAMLSVLEISSGQPIVEEHRRIETRVELDDALGSLIALMTESG